MEKEVKEVPFLKVKLADLEAEQRKLAKKVSLVDSESVLHPRTFGGCDTALVGKQIVASVVVVDENMNLLEEKSAIRKVTFPYIPGFLAYRELPALCDAYDKLEALPDVLFVDGNGILHPRRLGLASHFGLARNVPTIGIAKQLLLGEVKEGKIYVGNTVLGAVLQTKSGGKPIYVSQGHCVSLNTAIRLVKTCLRKPHKLPEPLHCAHRSAERLRKELAR